MSWFSILFREKVADTVVTASWSLLLTPAELMIHEVFVLVLIIKSFAAVTLATVSSH